MSRPLRPLTEPVHDVQRRLDWARDKDRCMVTGKTPRQLQRAGVWPNWLETHHIVKPGRSDEECNFFRVSALFHKIIEGERIPHPKGGYYPPITLANVLWLKQKHDPENYDPQRLMQLWGRASLPEPEPYEPRRRTK